MPTPLHEVFLARVVEEIQSRLREFTNSEGQSKAFAQKVKHNGSGTLDLKSENNDSQAIIKRQPNATFKRCDVH